MCRHIQYMCPYDCRELGVEYIKASLQRSNFRTAQSDQQLCYPSREQNTAWAYTNLVRVPQVRFCYGNREITAGTGLGRIERCSEGFQSRQTIMSTSGLGSKNVCTGQGLQLFTRQGRAKHRYVQCSKCSAYTERPMPPPHLITYMTRREEWSLSQICTRPVLAGQQQFIRPIDRPIDPLGKTNSIKARNFGATPLRQARTLLVI
jgi:hypothetical protein